MKKVIALVLSLILICSCCAVGAFAADAEPPISEPDTSDVAQPIAENPDIADIISLVVPNDPDYDLAIKVVTSIISIVYDYTAARDEEPEMDYDEIIAAAKIFVLLIYNLANLG